MDNGKFVISLDFELLWGVRDKLTIETYGENIKGVHKVIPRLLELFKQYNIHGTFSIVGFLFFKSKEELLNNLPDIKPAYVNKNLSPYEGHFDMLGENPASDPYHYAPHLIKLILEDPLQEIGTHTFSHYYCLEEGQTPEAFRADLQNAKKIAARYNIELTSLIFPRNQFNKEYLQICSEEGIICYRGNEHSWLYTARNDEKETVFRKIFRLADAYINISGHNCYADEYMKREMPMNIPATRFLRPYLPKLKFLERLRLKRIKSGMSYAAEKKLTYHLWWHPHNFGIRQEENFTFLTDILKHYDMLRKKYGFQSCTMSELSSKLAHDK